MKLIWSPLALERVTEIASFIHLDKPTAAKKWVITIFNKVKRLQKFPNSGRIVPEVSRPDVREIIFKNYRIMYRIKNKEVALLTVRHSKQILPIDELELED